MKTNSFLVFCFLWFIACSGFQKMGKVDISGDEEDSLQYELIILDAGFDTWFLTHSKPVWFYSQEWYENWNRQYVTAWNHHTTDSRSRRFFETYIDYRPMVNYGLDLNYKLFYYFQYVEKGLKIPILPHGYGPQAIP